MPLSSEIQASLKPVWTPIEASVRRNSGQWRLWANGPSPSEGSWYPRDSGWVWKWLVPHRSDHGDWLWMGEEPTWGAVPESNEQAWRLVGSQPLLEWVEYDSHDERIEPPYRRIWTEQSELLCFQGQGEQEVLQFMALLRAGKYGTDRTRIVLEDDSEEQPLYDQIVQRMKDRGEPISQAVLDAAALTGVPGQHLAILSEELRSAMETDAESALNWTSAELALQTGMSSQARIEAFLRFLSLGFGASAVEFVPGPNWKKDLGPRLMTLTRGLATQKFTEIEGQEGVLRFFWDSSNGEAVMSEPWFLARDAISKALTRLLRSGSDL